MNRYLKWLISKVEFLDFPEKYDRLFSALHRREFIWKHPMDKNRASDALELRNRYFVETGLKAPWHPVQATVLEVLISIASSMDFICSPLDEDNTKIIFWKLMSNLGLSDVSDLYYESLGGDTFVYQIIDRFMNREYDVDGRNGGLFPMKKPRQNQREVELWYQMHQYLSDPNGEDLKSF